MKIAIPVLDKTMETTVSPSFGRAAFFLFYDTDDNMPIFMENEAATSTGGAGIKDAESIINNNATVVITPSCGQNAADVLKGANISIYRSTEEALINTIEAFKRDELKLLDEIHPGHHGK
jgi:predicted Fe-Mo cluster-binding NifX family protein